MYKTTSTYKKLRELVSILTVRCVIGYREHKGKKELGYETRSKTLVACAYLKVHETQLTHEPEGRGVVHGHEPEAQRAGGDYDDGVAARAQQPHALRQHLLARARPLRRRFSELYHSNSLKAKVLIVKNCSYAC